MPAKQDYVAIPDWVGVTTGNPQIDQAFRIATTLVDEMRRKYQEQGGLPGWLPVSDGKRGPLVNKPDTRDSSHAVKMAAYLWGHQPNQAEIIEKAFHLDVINPKTGATDDPAQVKKPVVKQHAANTSMQLRCAADVYDYFPPGPQSAEAFRRAALTADWVQHEYDAEKSGLLDCHNGPTTTFWGSHLGEPDHFPANFDSKTKSVISTMVYCVWLQKLERAARRDGAPEADVFARHLARVRTALEERAWSERAGYYYLQLDWGSNQWFFSLNGLSESSHETDVTLYYAAEGEIAGDRRNSIARWIDHALWHDRVFPLPIFYPPYTWYSPEHPIYIDGGGDMFVLGGAWDTSYFHAVELLRESGLVDTLELAVRRRAESIVRDGDCTEWYYQDGTINTATGYHRDRYLVCATAQIAATIEGLFGVTPAAPHFSEINLAPALPLFRRHRHSAPPSPYAEKDNILRITLPEGKKLELTIRYSESNEVIRVKTNALNIPGHFRLPVDLASRVTKACWAGKEIPHRMDRIMDQAFVKVDHLLDGGELTVHLNPHPQKGMGTTPLIHPDGTKAPCGGTEPSPACPC
jgi:hypothetical protein